MALPAEAAEEEPELVAFCCPPQPATAIISPTDAQLKTAARWALVKDTAGTGYYDSKAIPLARIISRG